MGNESAMQRIEMLKDARPRNLILIGLEKYSMYQCAQELASVWLQTPKDELPYHPDYRELTAENDSIRVEQAEKIQRLASYKPQSEMAVCIVRDAETMTIEMQNKILKVLEDADNTMAVIFITTDNLIETVVSRCMKIEFKKIPLAEMAASAEYKSLPVLLASDGSPELYQKIVADTWFYQYLEGFYHSICSIKERFQLKNILCLVHALREKDKEYLPDKLENWQMQAFLCMIEKIYWHIMIKKMGLEVPAFIRLGNLPELYEVGEAELIFRKSEEAFNRNRKKGAFTKNDFFELIMYMIPTA